MPSSNPNFIPKCPGCGEEIESIDYYVSASESGSATIRRKEIFKWIQNANGIGGHEESTGKFKWETTDWDSNNTEWNDDPDYQCPNCGDRIYLNDLECPQGKSKKKKEKPIPPEPDDAVESATDIILREPRDKGSYHDRGIYSNAVDISQIQIVICEKCNHLISSSYSEIVVICPECNAKIDAKINRERLVKGLIKIK
jgi:predicted RNA-binding Zn-ribbon protein involved in translation (DUF1610 family)